MRHFSVLKPPCETDRFPKCFQQEDIVDSREAQAKEAKHRLCGAKSNNALPAEAESHGHWHLVFQVFTLSVIMAEALRE